MTPLRACLVALTLTLMPIGAQAELSAQELTRIDAPGTWRLLSSDGAVIGLSDGVTVQDGRVRLFLRPRGGSIFARGTSGKDIVVTTYDTLLTLHGGDLVLDATAQRIKNRANMSFTDDSSPIEVLVFTPG